jgi:S1-C subfamily serine protease
MRAFACLAVALLALLTGSAQTTRPVVDQPLPPANPKPLDLSAEEKVAVRVFEQANQSVVHIAVRGASDPFALPPARAEGSGSGCVLTTAGHVLTNYHVIGQAEEATVTLADGTSYPATLVGTDPDNDLAVLRIDAPKERLRPIAWGDSDQLRVGVRVFALGNPFGLERTMTAGMVGSLGRTMRADTGRLIRGVVQTDAAINPGNSGGPLLNSRGELVGITTAIIGRAGQSSGVGLAVPGNTARRVAEELIRHGRVVRADCGIEAAFRTDAGLLVARLTEGGPAEAAGVRGPEVTVVRRGGAVYYAVDRSRADVVVGVDGHPVKTMDELLSGVEAHKPGEKAVLNLLRDGKRTDVTVKLAEARR